MGFWNKAAALEVFKFSIYIIMPVGVTVLYTDPETMKVRTHIDHSH